MSRYSSFKTCKNSLVLSSRICDFVWLLSHVISWRFRFKTLTKPSLCFPHRMACISRRTWTKTTCRRSLTNAKSYNFKTRKTAESLRTFPIVTSRTIIYSGVSALTTRSRKRFLPITSESASIRRCATRPSRQRYSAGVDTHAQNTTCCQLPHTKERN